MSLASYRVLTTLALMLALRPRTVASMVRGRNSRGYVQRLTAPNPHFDEDNCAVARAKCTD
jgi:hypothetical protein